MLNLREKIMLSSEVRDFAKDVLKLTEGKNLIDCFEDLECCIEVITSEWENKCPVKSQYPKRYLLYSIAALLQSLWCKEIRRKSRRELQWEIVKLKATIKQLKIAN